MSQNQIILQSKNGPIYRGDLIDSFKEVGLNKGDIVMVHSRIFTLGKLADITEKEELLNIFIDILLVIIGNDGTLIFPTFTTSFCKTGLFDMKNSRSEAGVMSEIARNRPDSARTINPIHSVAIIGRHKKELEKASGETQFNENSIFDLLHRMNNSDSTKNKVKFLTIGIDVPTDNITFIHYIEEKMKVPYRYIKYFKGKIIKNGKKIESITSFFVRDLDANVKFDYTRCWNLFKQNNIFKINKLGNSIVCTVKEKDFYDVVRKGIQDNPDLLCFGGYKVK